MLTLREFLENINAYEHYRIYQPNRDCLIFESYFKVHSPYYFDKDSGVGFNDRYFNDNEYSNRVRETKEHDEETKTFLERFGNYEVFRLECSGFRPHNVKRDEETNQLVFEYVKDETQPNREYIDCFNIFIR